MVGNSRPNEKVGSKLYPDESYEKSKTEVRNDLMLGLSRAKTSFLLSGCIVFECPA